MSPSIKRRIALLLLGVFLLAACGAPQATAPSAAPSSAAAASESAPSEAAASEAVPSVAAASEAPSAAAAPAGETWDPADVTAATGNEQCEPLAQLPKQFTEPWTLGFINTNKGFPFWGTISQSMTDAAKFYGVEFVELDAAGDSSKMPDLMETLVLSQPSLVGTGGVGPDIYEALAARAQETNAAWLGLDTGPSAYSPYVYGIPDSFAGKTGAELLIQGVESRMANDWQGKDLYFVEFTHNGIPACVNRTGGAVSAFKDYFKLADDRVLQADSATGQTATDLMKAILTANPNAVFALIPCWDGLGLEAYTAAKDAGREGDLLMVTLGGDKPPADVLVTKPQGYFGYVEFQPYCEGWGWVESALAILEGVTFQPYQTRRVTTQNDIDSRYRELYGEPTAPSASP